MHCRSDFREKTETVMEVPSFLRQKKKEVPSFFLEMVTVIEVHKYIYFFKNNRSVLKLPDHVFFWKSVKAYSHTDTD